MKSICSFLICLGTAFSSSAQAEVGAGALNHDLRIAFQSQNHQWVCSRPPALFQDGLTYWLEAQVDLKRTSLTHTEFEKLYTEIYCQLLDSLNSQKAIRPYLASFPLTPETFFLTVSVESDMGKEFKKSVSTASVRQGMLELDIETVFGREVQRKSLSEIEALKALSYPKVIRSARALHIRFPFVTQAPVYGGEEKKATFDAAVKICRKHKLEILTVGRIGKDRAQEKSYQAAFFGMTSLPLEKARKLAADCVEEFLRISKKEIPFSSLQKKKRFGNLDGQLLKDVAFRISFWTDSIDRVRAPAIAEIHFFDDEIEYFTANDNQQLVLVFKEKPTPISQK